MPITVGEFTAWIVDGDGTTLPEYKVEVTGTQAVCWIPSEAGKSFAVHWRDTKLATSTSGRVHLDGFKCPGRVIKIGKKKHSHEVSRAYVRTSDTSLRRFTFGQMELTDDDSLLDGTSNTEHLGTIKLDIVRVNVHKIGPYKAITVPGAQKVHERAKKMGGHCVNFDADEYCAVKGSTHVTSIDKTPAATFVFRYRSLDLLQAQGIAPLESGRSTNKRKAEAPIKRELQSQQRAVKKEDLPPQDFIDLTQDLEHPRKRVKREPGAQPTHRGVFTSGEVIDLT